jgi:hypothetical protein
VLDAPHRQQCSEKTVICKSRRDQKMFKSQIVWMVLVQEWISEHFHRLLDDDTFAWPIVKEDVTALLLATAL